LLPRSFILLLLAILLIRPAGFIKVIDKGKEANLKMKGQEDDLRDFSVSPWFIPKFNNWQSVLQLKACSIPISLAAHSSQRAASLYKKPFQLPGRDASPCQS